MILKFLRLRVNLLANALTVSVQMVVEKSFVWYAHHIVAFHQPIQLSEVEAELLPYFSGQLSIQIYLQISDASFIWYSFIVEFFLYFWVMPKREVDFGKFCSIDFVFVQCATLSSGHWSTEVAVLKFACGTNLKIYGYVRPTPSEENFLRFDLDPFSPHFEILRIRETTTLSYLKIYILNLHSAFIWT